MTTNLENLFDSFLLEEEEDYTNSDQLDIETVIVRAQYILDGASSLEDAADMARAFADYLDTLAENGYELVSIIQDDRGLATITN